jgi:glyoxylate utilization-related uncharacterized protein
MHILSAAPGGSYDSANLTNGEEAIFVISGELDVSHDDQQYHLKSGDTRHFRSTEHQTGVNRSSGVTRLCWVAVET